MFIVHVASVATLSSCSVVGPSNKFVRSSLMVRWLGSRWVDVEVEVCLFAAKPGNQPITLLATTGGDVIGEVS